MAGPSMAVGLRKITLPHVPGTGCEEDRDGPRAAPDIRSKIVNLPNYIFWQDDASCDSAALYMLILTQFSTLRRQKQYFSNRSIC